jgi:hypothetical protein
MCTPIYTLLDDDDQPLDPSFEIQWEELAQEIIIPTTQAMQTSFKLRISQEEGICTEMDTSGAVELEV